MKRIEKCITYHGEFKISLDNSVTKPMLCAMPIFHFVFVKLCIG